MLINRLFIAFFISEICLYVYIYKTLVNNFITVCEKMYYFATRWTAGELTLILWWYSGNSVRDWSDTRNRSRSSSSCTLILSCTRANWARYSQREREYENDSEREREFITTPSSAHCRRSSGSDYWELMRHILIPPYQSHSINESLCTWESCCAKLLNMEEKIQDTFELEITFFRVSAQWILT